MGWKAWIRDWRVQVGAGIVLVSIIAVSIWISRLSRIVDLRLRQGVFANTLNVYSAPKTIFPGMTLTVERTIAALRRSGYTDTATNLIGHYRLTGDSIEIHPGFEATVKEKPARVQFLKGRVGDIVEIETNKKLKDYRLEPQLVTNLAGEARQKRRLLKFGDLPKTFIDTLLSAEDRKFFEHSGFDAPRLVKVVFINLRSGRKEQGGSTLTMQLARNIWLDQGKTWRRKITEMAIAALLETKLTKQEILEHYINEVYLGNIGSYEIHGFGEASWRYFNRDLGHLNLEQWALLAGIVQRPNYFDPIRHPERAVARRNSILSLMARNGSITQAQLESAQTAALGVDPRGFDGGEAPYFVDLALDETFRKLPEAASARNSMRVYTTLDPDLQQYATEAVRIGMEKVDKLLAAKHKKDAINGPPAQAALLALDPKTGEVRAAVGGRNYGISQLNRILAKRQPGSVFKPFVFAAAMETQIGNRSKVFTGASILIDEPTTFQYGDEIYEPANFGQRYNGEVTLRRALTRSLNVPTVALAEEIGYKRVVDVAKRAGINSDIRATPAVALGAYVTTPLEIAGAYTVFANQGKYVAPSFLVSISRDGATLYGRTIETKQALDPRVTFLMLDMLQDVMRSGTAGGVWSYGFRQQAAGKTGTSRDGWFAGFTSGLICVVWVGYDDNRDLDLEGAKSALPIWAEFMKRATQDGAYSGALAPPPQGITTATIDQDSGELAGPQCPGNTRVEFFIAGAEPKNECTEQRARDESNTPHYVPRESRAATISDGRGQIGMAVWYRPKTELHGSELAAAHPSYPNGTRVRVTNLANGKAVIVRIDGRIAASGAVISLNQQAAQELDFMRLGSAQVRVEMTDRP